MWKTTVCCSYGAVFPKTENYGLSWLRKSIGIEGTHKNKIACFQDELEELGNQWFSVNIIQANCKRNWKKYQKKDLYKIVILDNAASVPSDFAYLSENMTGCVPQHHIVLLT